MRQPEWARAIPCPVGECGGTGFISNRWTLCSPCMFCSPAVEERRAREREQRQADGLLVPPGWEVRDGRFFG